MRMRPRDISAFRFLSFKRMGKWDLKEHGLYVKLGDNKFVIVKGPGDDLDPEVIDRYQRKSLEGLFISDESFQSLVGEKANHLNKILEDENACREVKLSAEIEAFQTVTEGLNSMGIDERMIKLADNAIKSSINNFAADEDMLRLFEKVLGGVDFLSEHSILTSYFCYFTLDKLGKLKESDMNSYAMAAMLHDVGVKEKSAKVHDVQSQEFEEIRPDSRKKILEHCDHGAELAQTLPNSNSIVADLIRQHHESPDGKGFPLGLSADEIAPHSVVFIVCHELSAWLAQVENIKEPNLSEFFDKELQRFSHPKFAETFHALESFLLD